jgi:AP-1 complex subunit mu
MSSAIFLTDLKGKILISRNYRGDVPISAIEKFANRLQEEEEADSKPVYTEGGVTYVYVRSSNLYVLSVTKKNSNVFTMMLFMLKTCAVLKEYFGNNLTEESVRDNFVVIYELLDEMMDFGFPQTTEQKILAEYITQESNRSEKQPRPPMALTNAVSWRSEGIVHRKNEIFLDVIETLNLLVSSSGQVLHSEIIGVIKMKSFLSGMPELKLGLNDKLMLKASGRNVTKGKAVEMEDIKFHQCVRLARFENDRTISFIPPDGEFELMSYRLNTTVKPLIWVEAVVEPHKSSRIEYMIRARSQFKSRSIANNVEITIPVPNDVDSPSFKAAIGTVTYVPDKDAIVWSIKQFYGAREYLMRAHFGLPSTTDPNDLSWKKPAQVTFEIPYFTVSGIQVRYLKIIEKSGYQALPWVRYITKAAEGEGGRGGYTLRMS